MRRLQIEIPDRHYLNSKDTLPQEDVPAGRVNVVIDGVSGVDHQAVDKLH